LHWVSVVNAVVENTVGVKLVVIEPGSQIVSFWPLDEVLGGRALAGMLDDFVWSGQPVFVDRIIFGEVVVGFPGVV
jgi:hypothetical protein